MPRINIIAEYGTAISYTKVLERHDIAGILLDILREEKAANMALSELTGEQINADAKWTSTIRQIEDYEKTKLIIVCSYTVPRYCYCYLCIFYTPNRIFIPLQKILLQIPPTYLREKSLRFG